MKPTRTRRRLWPWIVAGSLTVLCVVGCVAAAVFGPPAAVVGVVHDDDDGWDAEDCRNAEPDCPWYLRQSKPTPTKTKAKPTGGTGTTGKNPGKVDTKKDPGKVTKPKPRP